MCDNDWFASAEAALTSTGRTLPEAPQDDRPVVAVYGAYDAGKSTLVKRLLVEAGQPVPLWLTISARPETFEANDVEAFGCVLRDTPGIAGGNALHQQAADRALLDADVTMLVMPPQLLTGDLDHVLDRISGRAYRSAGLFAPESLLFVIAKLDDGEDPSENLQGYRRRVDLKRAEWANLLSSKGVPADAVPLFTISADPYGDVGNDPEPAPYSYRAGCRAWDGVDDLIAVLQALPDHLPELRYWRRVRCTCLSLGQALDQAREQNSEAKRKHGDAIRQSKSIEQFAERHAQFEQFGRDALSGALEAAVNSFFTRRSDDWNALRDELGSICNGWLIDQLDGLQKLVDDSMATLSQPLHADAIELDMPANRGKARQPKGANTSPLGKDSGKYPAKITRQVMGIARDSRLNGKTTTMLEKDYKKAQDAANKATDKRTKAYRSAQEELAKVGDDLKTSRRMDQAQDVALILAEFGFDWFRDESRRRASAEATVEELAIRQRRLEECAARASKAAADRLAPHLADYRRWLNEQTTYWGDAVARAVEDQSRLQDEIGMFHQLIDNAPVFLSGESAG